ncbi:hypothetical protein COLO4_24786 [Corchorus olitorius]|uniref:Protein kinase domain-containing protein n=1 Tax=Corchorus olitorius TaxID=93759 RepID=A0A1R3I6W0_9ROSI|nr:hypothetical protein COLO4_24786 [Corchorus olitorius]
MYKVLKRRENIKRRQRYFKKNGGLLLQQQLSSNEGQGTVYKGMLADGGIVAIKKSKPMKVKKKPVVLDEKQQVEQWVNESEEFPLTWDMRLRIIIEVANALSYLHSAASVPIYHRDIKSKNIPLDGKYRAKVSDFGISKSIALDQTHLSTRVQGTFGYLDPEYFQSNQFTEKSDVYSFGVVVAELLTGQKPSSCMQSDEELRSLVPFFLLSMKEKSLFDILDPRVKHDGPQEEIIAVAKLAKRCLNLNGKRRPIMKQVVMEFEWIKESKHDNFGQQISDVDEDFEDDRTEPWTTISCPTTSIYL